MANEMKRTIDDISDSVKEGIHRGNAAAEHETRKDFGDDMTTGEKVDSVANEAGENIKAGVDKTKRGIRDL